MLSDAVIGIDLGTTNSCVAVMEGKVSLLVRMIQDDRDCGPCMRHRASACRACRYPYPLCGGWHTASHLRPTVTPPPPCLNPYTYTLIASGWCSATRNCLSCKTCVSPCYVSSRLPPRAAARVPRAYLPEHVHPSYGTVSSPYID